MAASSPTFTHSIATGSNGWNYKHDHEHDPGRDRQLYSNIRPLQQLVRVPRGWDKFRWLATLTVNDDAKNSDDDGKGDGGSGYPTAITYNDNKKNQ